MNRWNILTDFLHVDTWPQNLKSGQNSFGSALSKMGGASLSRVLKMNRQNEVIFFPAGTNSGKLKADSIIFGWRWSKMVKAF